MTEVGTPPGAGVFQHAPAFGWRRAVGLVFAIGMSWRSSEGGTGREGVGDGVRSIRFAARPANRAGLGVERDQTRARDERDGRADDRCVFEVGPPLHHVRRPGLPALGDVEANELGRRGFAALVGRRAAEVGAECSLERCRVRDFQFKLRNEY